MNRFIFTIILSLQTLMISAGIATFEEMTKQLNEKSLPIINLVVEIDNVTKADYTNATIEIVTPPTINNKKNVSTTYNCKVKYRGTSSLIYDKKSFKIKLIDDKGKSIDAKIFGIRKDDSWILDAMAIDRIRMRNRVCFDIWNEMSSTPYTTDYDKRNGTKGVFVELFINDKYHGLYCMSDKINRKLLGVKKVDDDDNDSPVIKGVIYKGDQWSNATRLNGYDEESMYEASWNSWELNYPEDYPCPEAYMPLKNFIDYCVNTSDDDFKKGIEDNFYLQNFADYQVFFLSQGLGDNHIKNTYLSIVNINKGHRFMITPWDLDCSLGGNYDGSYKSSVVTMRQILSVGLYRRLWNLDINGYKSLVATRWQQLYKTTLSEDAFNKRIDAYANDFIESGAWEREFITWNGKPVTLKQDLTDEIRYVKDWYHRNCENLANNIYKDITSETKAIAIPTPTGHQHTIYNMCGQKVDTSYKGIIIKDGHKLIVR